MEKFRRCIFDNLQFYLKYKALFDRWNKQLEKMRNEPNPKS